MRYIVLYVTAVDKKDKKKEIEFLLTGYSINSIVRVSLTQSDQIDA